MAKLRRKGKTREAKLLLICCEGAETEPQYFAHWAQHFPRVNILVVTPSENRSAPEYIVQLAKHHMRKLKFEEGDDAWLVTDRDRWPGKQLNILHQESKRQKLKQANSDPNFHVWLLAHFETIGVALNKLKIDTQLQFHMGSFNKTNLEMHRFLPLVSVAIANAMDSDRPGTAISSGQTRVYLLMQEVLRLSAI